MYKLAFPPTPSLVGNRIKLKKIKWGRREGESEEGKGEEGKWKGRKGREWKENGKEKQGGKEGKGKREVKEKIIGSYQDKKCEGGEGNQVSGNYIHPCRNP